MNKTYLSFLLLIATSAALFSADQQAQEHVKTLQQLNRVLKKNGRATKKRLKESDELLEQTKKKLEEQEQATHKLLAVLVGSASKMSDAIDAIPQLRKRLGSAIEQLDLPEETKQLYQNFDKALTQEFKRQHDDIPGTQDPNAFNSPLLEALFNASSLQFAKEKP